jgi:L,D-transpeptidase ErfK/SrfK
MNASALAADLAERLSGRAVRRWWRDGERARVLRFGGHRRTALLSAGAILSCLAALALSSGYEYEPFPEAYGETVARGAGGVTSPTATSPVQLRREAERLRTALSRSAPRGTYIVVDRSNNRVYLRRQDRLLMTATASTGSGFVLREASGRRRTWVFDTPQGAFKVVAKVEDPVWKKPDWAFIEEGKPIPLDPSDRFDYGSLGEYALYFGDGYMIHGTLYERLLGRSVTHGCIRLGREDLRKIYGAVHLGTPIYVY